ncbi:MAG: type II toxin-antitoxin system PemK/MazF family toxin [Pseudonocardiaceae bacterium]|nr:type II toxin-antitoxin system PemK/MazF family toxin [Pseudonocardiaceae bacterium]
MSQATHTAEPRRGEIWLVDFGTPIGHEQGYRRPAVVVSADRLNSSRAGLVIVVPVTRTRRNLPSHVEIEPAESGLRDVSYAKCEDIKSVSRERLVHRIGDAPEQELHRIIAVIVMLIDK